MRRHRPPRLPGFSYRGFYRYFLTFCTKSRLFVFTRPEVVGPTLDEVLRTASERGFALPAYCFMPDHLHALAEGTRQDSDLRLFVKVTKQRGAVRLAQEAGIRDLWQEGYYQRVLRSDESTLDVARYIFENPVRAGLVRSPVDYPFSGSQTGSVAEILASLG